MTAENNPSAESEASSNPPAASEAVVAPLPTPWLTFVVIGVCTAIFAYLNLAQNTSSFNQVTEILAPSAVSIWTGYYWGLLTSALVHFEIWHFLFNMWWAKDFGKLLEPTLGRLPYLIFLAAAAVASGGVELATTLSVNKQVIGFSGVVYAMFGFGLAARKTQPLYEKIVDRNTTQWLLGWLVLCIVLTIAGIWNVANAAHVGGLVFGYLAGTAWALPRFRVPCVGAAAALIGVALISCFYLPWSGAWNDRAAIRHLRELRWQAEAGVAKAQHEFGHFLFRYVAERRQEGLQLIKKSAEQGHVPAMNSIAWISATAVNDKLRNGAEALKWASDACAKDGWKEANYIDTLAAAYAEADRWKEAVETQQKAIDQLTVEQQNNTNLLQSFRKRLEQYQNQQKARE